MLRFVLIVVLLSALSAPVLAQAPAEVRRIVVDTDRSVNCSSLKAIADDLCRGLKTDQEKAVAIYDFMVRAIWMDWHSHRPLELQPDGRLLFANDPVKYITVYGFAGCGPQSGIHGALCEAAGLKFRTLDPGFGHVSGEVGWDGKWHWMDIWLPAYVTDAKGGIYSYDEIMADRSLFANARKEGRAPGNFMVNYDADVKAVVNAKGHKPGGGPYTEKYTEDLRLRPGESCAWLWGNVGKWYNPSGPYVGKHLDRQFPSGPATKFGNDLVLKDAFPFWEPYRKTIEDGPHSSWNKTYYRYYGNAIFTHAPPLTEQGLKDFSARLDGLSVTPDGLALTKGEGGQTEISFHLPYVIADTEIEGEAGMGLGGGISFCYSVDGGKTWLLGGEVKTGGRFGPIRIGQPNTYEFPAGSTSGRYGFDLRIVFRSSVDRKPVVLKGLKVTDTTMLNFYSRPQLLVGDNQVTVTAEGLEALKAAPLEITWKWVEDWETDKPAEKTFTHKADKTGATATITVGGKKIPRMKSVTIAR